MASKNKEYELVKDAAEDVESLESLESGDGVTAPEKSELKSHPALYIITWIFFSSSVILFNKWVLDSLKFNFPVLLTTWHLLFASVATQLLARFTHLLDGRHKVAMDISTYTRAILPIGFFFSLSLICCNVAYLSLSVSYIQMVKAMTPVIVLLITWMMKLEKPTLKIFLNICVIAIGVMIASYSETNFDLTGFLFQFAGLIFEGTRLVLVQRLLSAPEYKMDPLVSLYFFAPICALFNFLIFLFTEASRFSLVDLQKVGVLLLILNASVALCLNISVVFLIGKTSSLVLTLCGILKDILLVISSVLIWASPITVKQLFGYSVALTGLVYYKLGAQQIKTLTQNTIEQLHRSKIYRMIAAIVLGIVGAGVLLYMFPPTFSAQPSNLANVRPRGSSVASIAADMDIVLTTFSENPDELENRLTALVRDPHLSNKKIRIFIYDKNPEPHVNFRRIDTHAVYLFKLENIGRESDSTLRHFIAQYDNLSDLTMFLQGDFEVDNITRNFRFLRSNTGIMAMSGLGLCDCNNCNDPFGGVPWPHISEMFSLTNGETCPSTGVLLCYQGKFVVSRKRIRSNSREAYGTILNLLNAPKDHFIHRENPDPARFEDSPNNPFFGHVVERMWLTMFHCFDSKLATICPFIGDGFGCQCYDE